MFQSLVASPRAQEHVVQPFERIKVIQGQALAFLAKVNKDSRTLLDAQSNNDTPAIKQTTGTFIIMCLKNAGPEFGLHPISYD